MMQYFYGRLDKYRLSSGIHTSEGEVSNSFWRTFLSAVCLTREKTKQIMHAFRAFLSLLASFDQGGIVRKASTDGNQIIELLI